MTFTVRYRDPSTPIYISCFSYKLYRNPIELLELEKYSNISYIWAKKLLNFLYFDIKFGTILATVHSVTGRFGPEAWY